MPKNSLIPKTGAPTPSLHFDNLVCSELATSENLEWLVTNGMGGFATGTVANLLTRRYHGLLIAALRAPLERALMAAKLDDTVEYDGQIHRIFTNRWGNILVEPHGYRHIQHFHLEGTTPVWTYIFGDARLEKRIWMQPGENTTYVFYQVFGNSAPLTLRARPLVNYRDSHGETHRGDGSLQVKRADKGLWIRAFEEAVPFRILSDRATIDQEYHWYRNFSLSMEQSNGYVVSEDHLNVGEFHVSLGTNECVTFVFSTESSPNLNGAAALAERNAYEARIVSLAPGMPEQLVLAADQFIVRRDEPEHPDGRSILAGYPWLRDWSRDTLISLPGLTLATGRSQEARCLLVTFSRFISQGMLPSCLPQPGESPEYNTMDVTLWYFEAIRAYFEETGDVSLLEELFPALADIIEWHERGTRFNIHIDPADGLLYGGEPGIQLTWMDSKYGDWVVTPRTGKPVEINALWYNALCSMGEFANRLGKPSRHYEKMAGRVKNSFSRFWNNDLGFCYDVIDTPDGNDPTLRPNQLLAVSLKHSPLGISRQKAVVRVCESKLLTPVGLRSMAQDEPGYVGQYGGDARQQVGAYHRGTVWAWLIGPFVSAHLRVYGNPRKAARFIQPLMDHLSSYGVGSISELFDGDPPFTPRGCVAQAWSVAELLRAWREVNIART